MSSHVELFYDDYHQTNTSNLSGNDFVGKHGVKQEAEAWWFSSQRVVVRRNKQAGHEELMQDYFGENALFGHKTFWRRMYVKGFVQEHWRCHGSSLSILYVEKECIWSSWS